MEPFAVVIRVETHDKLVAQGARLPKELSMTGVEGVGHHIDVDSSHRGCVRLIQHSSFPKSSHLHWPESGQEIPIQHAGSIPKAFADSDLKREISLVVPILVRFLE